MRWTTLVYAPTGGQKNGISLQLDVENVRQYLFENYAYLKRILSCMAFFKYHFKNECFINRMVTSC